ncbi:MAG: hypothetical protein E7229_06830 [Clostridiales bacterium]|nr:hypothetical protein [Clostridiales bacterium]
MTLLILFLLFWVRRKIIRSAAPFTVLRVPQNHSICCAVHCSGCAA